MIQSSIIGNALSKAGFESTEPIEQEINSAVQTEASGIASQLNRQVQQDPMAAVAFIRDQAINQAMARLKQKRQAVEAFNSMPANTKGE